MILRGGVDERPYNEKRIEVVFVKYREDGAPGAAWPACRESVSVAVALNECRGSNGQYRSC